MEVWGQGVLFQKGGRGYWSRGHGNKVKSGWVVGHTAKYVHLCIGDIKGGFDDLDVKKKINNNVQKAVEE